MARWLTNGIDPRVLSAAAWTTSARIVEALAETDAAEMRARRDDAGNDLRLARFDAGRTLWVCREDEPDAKPVRVEVRGKVEVTYEARIAPEPPPDVPSTVAGDRWRNDEWPADAPDAIVDVVIDGYARWQSEHRGAYVTLGAAVCNMTAENGWCKVGGAAKGGV
jgi:hypothetical protein